MYVFSKYNYVTLKHLEYLVDLFIKFFFLRANSSSILIWLAYRWRTNVFFILCTVVFFSDDAASFEPYTCTHTLRCIAAFSINWINVKSYMHCKAVNRDWPYAPWRASLIIKAKIDAQNIDSNTTNQQPFQFNRSLHLKTVSIFFFWRLQHQYNNLNGYSDILIFLLIIRLS